MDVSKEDKKNFFDFLSGLGDLNKHDLSFDSLVIDGDVIGIFLLLLKALKYERINSKISPGEKYHI